MSGQVGYIPVPGPPNGGQLMAGKALEITDANFESSILQADKPALVDFWAVWCGPCKMIAPAVEALADEMEGKAVVGKLDVDANRDTATKYGIMSIPTLLIFKDGELVDKIVGASVNKDTLKEKLELLA